MLRHDYTYWDNGKLREARYSSEGQPASVEQFDRAGKPVTPPVVAPAPG